MDFPIQQHLIPIFQEEKYRLLLQKQLRKDFSASGLDLPDELDEAVFKLSDLFELVRQQLVSQLEKGERHTLNLMYLIDIPEKQFTGILGDDDFTDKLTRMILEREATKIYFRVKYS